MGNKGSFTSKTASARLGFGVGDLEFLNSEQSKVEAYYRGLEYGSEKFLGREIFGVFGAGSRLNASGTAFFGPIKEFAGGKGQQQFFPLHYAASLVGGKGTATAKLLRHLRKTGLVTRGGVTLANQRGSNIVVRVEHPIIAQNAYSKAFKSFQPGVKEEEAVRQVMGKLGFAVEGRGGVINNQRKVFFIDQRTRGKAPVTASQIRKRFGVITGGATSGYTGSLVNVDRTFQSELIRINKLLAEGLAAEVAKHQQELIKRKDTTSGKLINATLDPRNRFPR